ncbi:MAG TPA: magnesium transporter CorA family protein [Gammaproteobacteria bacterium]|jgi:magnesium transporter|nr:magnesium transporter CorA family protein [Gammaproteobacteria bacterium]
MIIAYSANNKFKPFNITSQNPEAINESLWIDLLNPTKEEETLLENILGIDIPTREEMQEIEVSSRLYKEDGAIFMTVTMVAKSDSLQPNTDAVTLILVGNKLITVRYIEPHSFASIISRIGKILSVDCNAIALLIEILDASVDRLADILEKVSHGLDNYSQAIFRSDVNGNAAADKPDYKHHLEAIAVNGDLTTKVQESLITFNRLITFFGQISFNNLNSEQQSRLTILAKDINSLSDYVNFLSTKINFLLDATLGLVNIEQNNIIKIFSIAAVILLPPTLVASIYGMNFHHMPELAWRWGYPFAILLMLIAAWLPYKYFKMKKWL